MSRRDQVSTSLPNPTDRFYTFKGKQDGFVWYNKEKGQEEVVTKLSFILLTVRNEVSGYHKRTKSSIWSNSISEFGSDKEELRVYSDKADANNNKALAQGLWLNIREQVRKQGGHFTKVIMGYQVGVGIIKISLVGTAIASYGKFVDELKDKKDKVNKFIEVKEYKRLQEDDDYTVPVFTTGKEPNEKVDQEAEVAFKTVETYFESKNIKVTDANENNTEQEYNTGVDPSEVSIPQMATVEDGDDLPF